MTEKRLDKNLAGGVLFLGIGAVILLLIPSQIAPPEPGMIGPRFVPTLMAAGMILASIVLIVQGLAAKKGAGILLRELLPDATALATAGLVVLWIAGLFAGIGYLPATLALVLAGLLLFRVRGWLNYAIGLAFTVMLWAAFRFLLHVQLP